MRIARSRSCAALAAIERKTQQDVTVALHPHEQAGHVPQHRARGMTDLEHAGAGRSGTSRLSTSRDPAPATLTAAQASLWSVSAAPGIETGPGPMTNHWSSPLHAIRVSPLLN
jgi:hypothetical protein